MSRPAQPEPFNPSFTPATLTRCAVGGLLMGLANLVPGISGGTMLLAAGVYSRFIHAVSDVTRLRFRLGPLLSLGAIAAAAGLAILLGAGPVKHLVVEHRWVMYSLFIGLTLGGVPLVWSMARPVTPAVTIGGLFGLFLMITMSLRSPDGGSSGTGFVLLLVAGLAGASAMILPGVSGGYLLLLLGQYVPILSAIADAKDALAARDVPTLMSLSLHVFLPVGLGVVAGIVGVSNALRWALDRHPKPTLGLLLGLLLGAVIGLWPFQQGVEPVVGETVIKGQLVIAENVDEIEAEDWPVETFTPGAGQIVGSLALIGAGFGVTVLIARFGKEKKTRPDHS